MKPNPDNARLARVLNTPGAVLLGLGAIVGTGVYVSIGIAAGVAGPMVMPAIAIAAFVALCNGLSSAQLAATHPVSGGTYEYGYRYLNTWLGFLAGWLFLVAKSASAATAALGFAAYLLSLFGGTLDWQAGIAVAVTVVVTAIVLIGLRNTSRVNAVLVIVSVGALLAFVAFAMPLAWAERASWFDEAWPRDSAELASLLQAAALMFVAFTGYGRVATLGEEVLDPRRSIPRAILWTVALTFALYVGVAMAAIGSTDAAALGDAARRGLPLGWAARQLGHPALASIVAIGAVVAMAGVLLNLVLGLSRVVLAMARRRDMPRVFARLDGGATSAPFAVMAVGALVALIALVGDIRTAWSFSAFTVLLYYAITNLAALRVEHAQRFVPRIVSMIGLAGCAGLAWFVDTRVWLAGLALVVAGLAWHVTARKVKDRLR